MNKLKYILIYLFIVLTMGCRAKKNVSEKVYIEKNDSTRTTLQLNTSNKIEISQLCDSITGKPKNFTNTVDNGFTKVTTTIKDNKLTTDIQGDSVKYVDRIVKEKIYVDKVETVIEYKTPKWIWYFIGVLLAYILAVHIFVKLPSIINSLIRKLVGLM